MVVLDTTFLIDVLQRQPGAIARMEAMRDTHRRLSTTTISVAEVLCGASASGRRDLDVAARMFRSLEVFEFDYRSAEIAGGLLADLEARGEALGFADTLIASVALRHRDALVTRDAGFDRVPGLRVERY